MVETQTVSRSWASDHSFHVAKIRGYNYGAREPFSADETASALPYGGTYSSNEQKATKYTLQNQLSFSREINEDHTFFIQGISYLESLVTKGYGSSAYGWRGDRGQLISPTINAGNYQRLYNAGLLSPTIVDNVKNKMAWRGNAAYTFRDKLIIDGRITSEASNQFGDNPKYRFLPLWSISGKYTLSNEEFLKENDLLTYLAVRASYGFQGNVDSNTSPDLVVKLESYSSAKHFDMSSIYMLPNPDLRWEKTESYNIGVDFAFGKGRVSGQLDVYKKFHTDLILQSQLPQYNGIEFTKINGGKMTNTGFDIDLTGYPVRTKDWEVSVGVVMGQSKNVITKANSLISGSNQKNRNANQVNGNAILEGQALGSLWAYRFAGLDHETGFPLFYENGESHTYLNNGVPYDASDTLAVRVPNFNVFDDAVDIVCVGAPTPTLTGGLNLKFRYKNLTLRTGLTFSVGGVDRLPALYNGEYNHVFDPIYNVSKEFVNRWKKPGDEEFTNIPVLHDEYKYQGVPRRNASTGGLIRTTTDGIALYDKSDIMVAPTDNLRMNRLGLSYILRGNSLRISGVQSLEFSFDMTNLFLIADKAWRGRDPEQSTSANVRPPSTYTLGVNLSF